MEAGRIAVQRLAAAQENDADHEENNDRQHFHQREPELHFGEPFHPNQVHGADNRQRAQREDPLRHIAKRAPVVHIERHRGDIDNAGHRPVDEIHPARDIRGFFTQKLARIRDKTAAGRPMQYQFA